MNSIILGARLQAMRLYRRMSQAELGQAIGRSKSMICRYEGGLEFSASTADRMAAALRFATEAFFDKDPDGFDPRKYALENLERRKEGGG